MFYNLADEYVSYESEVDQKVATPLHKLLETDISKLKKNLNKYVSDRDSANNRLQVSLLWFIYVTNVCYIHIPNNKT